MSKVLITAGGSGLGKAMATAFHDAGHEVWATDISDSGLGNVPWQTTRTDSSSETENQSLFSEIQSAWGWIDVVCANAGIAGPTAGIENVSLDDWRECVAVNLEGAFLTAKYATPLMKQQRSGAMIFTSSTAGIFGYPNRAPYAAAKWGIIGLMKTIAMELGPFGVRANVIAPGAVEGPRMEGVLAREAATKGMTRDEVYKGYAAGTSMRTFVTAQDVAAMALFLGSDAAARVSGQVIAVDGHTENPDPKS
jgi:NAD(P)-dependent dehydrogenase (short-subunit alcohol dehydrogenase family)